MTKQDYLNIINRATWDPETPKEPSENHLVQLVIEWLAASCFINVPWSFPKDGEIGIYWDGYQG